MFNLYYHGGSANHGCEAIVRATAEMIAEPIYLYSKAPEEDRRYKLPSAVSLTEDMNHLPQKGTAVYYCCAVSHKLRGDDYAFHRAAHRELFASVQKGDVWVSIGGDNYCYDGLDVLACYNKEINRHGGKTVLWGCSVEPELLRNPAIVQDMKLYSLITARESLTYEALQTAGLEKILLCPDPAFLLKQVPPLQPLDGEKQYVGINVSPLVVNVGDMVFTNYERLAEYILKETPFDILLIPHVVKPESDDRTALLRLATRLNAPDRVTLIEDQTCEQLKGIIAQCRFFIGARTHASIAAYSTCVPTVVTGYSVKAKGIAKDIFGTWEHFVVPVQELQGENELTAAFQWLQANETAVRNHLQEFMPDYCEKARLGAEAVKRLASC